MEIDRNLLKEFAKITNDSEVKQETKYLRGTIVSNSSGKYVQIDGSTTITPISEIIDVEEGDRVLVTIENHKATIVGNFSFPPSARKEQEAIDKATNAETTANGIAETANIAQQKAQEASDKADTAISQSSIASASADEAKQQASEAIASANTANENIQETKELAAQASADASEAKTQAAASQAASANAQAEVTRLNSEVASARENIDSTLEELSTQAGEIAGIKENYALSVEVDNAKAELSTEITKKVGELQATVEKDYATKTENVELEGRLQTQITQNAEGFSQQASKIEQLESDTTQAQKDVAEALTKASAAQTAAEQAQSNAAASQAAADTASANAADAVEKATLAQNAANAATAAANAADQAVQSAQSDLNEAKQNLANVTSRVDATEADIAEAQSKVDAAQTAVNNALADAAEARTAANNATEAATKAQQDAETAQGVAAAAQQKADNAKTAADNAQAAADKAQEDVAALTSRVTNAETSISNNAEAINLNAIKTTEIGDKLKNDYYSKTETDAKIKIESDKIEQTVTKVETVEKNFNDLEIGGRNLLALIKSPRYISPITYGGITISQPDSEGWFTVSGTTTGGGSARALTLWGESVNEANEYLPSEGGEYELSVEYTDGTFISGSAYTNSTHIAMYYESSNKHVAGFNPDCITANVGSYIYRIAYYIGIDVPDDTVIDGKFRIKLEKGNKATDWTPAPEDVDSGIANAQTAADNAQTTADNAQSEVTKAQSTIEQLADMIANLVTDQNGTSLMTQTSNGWTFEISSITGNLDAISEAMSNMETNNAETNDALTKLTNLVNSISSKTAYINIGKDDSGNPCIELGKADNDFKVRITNTAVDFLQGSSKIAYANNNTFYATRMIVKNELQIGSGPGFVWRVRSNGNMGLVYISS